MHQIAIGILSFNHPEITAKCVRSVLQHFDGQVFLLHNGSTKENIGKLKMDFPKLNHLVLPVNSGFAGGATKLLDQCFQKTEWLLFLSNDCELLTPLRNQPKESGLYAPKIFRRKSGQVDSLGGYWDLKTFRLRHCRTEGDFRNLKHKCMPYIPGAAFWIDRGSWLRLRPFQLSLSSYWEDVDLSFRAQAMGMQLQLFPDTEITHGIGKTCSKDPHYTTYLFQRNRAWIARKHLARALFFRFVFRYTIDSLQSAFRCLTSGRLERLRLTFRAFRDGLFSKDSI